MGKISDMVICDLRYVSTPEQAKEIEEISDVVMLILPKDASPEVMAAIASIPKSDIVMEIPVSKDAAVSTVNGASELGEGFFPAGKEAFIIINGIGILSDLPENCSGSFIVNGMMIINEKLKSHQALNFSSINGTIIWGAFEEYKFFANAVDIDADMLRYFKPNTAIIAGNEIKIAPDVTVEMLQSQNTKLIAGNKVICRREIAGYVKATAIVGNKIEITD